MSKRITKIELENKVNLLEQANEKMAVNIKNSSEVMRSQENIIANIRAESSKLVHELDFTKGRCQEVIIAHDILLKSSLREQGVSWEDIDRMINTSRGNFRNDSGFGIGRSY